MEAFRARLVDKDPASLIFLDEAGIDDTETRLSGYSPRGQRCPGTRPGHRSVRVNMLAALRQNEIIAPFTFEGYTNRLLFEAWFERHLCPCLRPGDTVILDNASFHKSDKIDRLAAQRGASILFLPPYSPDENHIECHWPAIKNRIRKNADIFYHFRDAVDQAFSL